MSRSKTRDIAANELRFVEDGIIDSDAIADGTFTTDTAFANATISLAKITDDAKEFKPINLTFDSAQTLDLSQGNFFNADSTNGVNTTLSFTNVPAAGKWSYIVKHGSSGSTYNTATDITGWTWDFDNRINANTVLSSDTWIEASLEDSGNKLYIAANSTDTIYQLDLSTPYDLRTASSNASLAIGSNTSQIRNIKFKPDGTRMFCSDGADGTLDVYNLSTPWDITTATYQSGLSINAAEIGANQFSIFFTPDGLKMYLTDRNTAIAYQYTLSTAWDPSSASYDSKSLNMSAYGSSMGDIALSKDGKKLFKTNSATSANNADTTGGSFTQYNLGTAFDISTGDSGTTRVLNTLFDSGVTHELHKMNITYDGDYAIFGGYNNTNYQYYLARIPDSSDIVQSTLTLPASVQNAVSNTPSTNNPRQYIEFITYDSGTNIYINNDKTFST